MKLARLRIKMTGTTDEVDDLAGDGCSALPGVVEKFADLSVEQFLGRVHCTVRWAFSEGFCNRGPWAKRIRKGEYVETKNWRRRFVRKHGRVPTADEREAFISTLINNPNIEVKVPRKINFSALDQGDSTRARTYADPCAADPSMPVVNRETMRLALKGLSPVDQTILKMLLDGEAPIEISKTVRLTKATMLKRLNGVLWEARCRADLAAYLDVEPEQNLPMAVRGLRPSIEKFPPARLVG
jgi:hypothetical protein